MPKKGLSPCIAADSPWEQGRLQQQFFSRLRYNFSLSFQTTPSLLFSRWKTSARSCLWRRPALLLARSSCAGGSRRSHATSPSSSWAGEDDFSERQGHPAGVWSPHAILSITPPAFYNVKLSWLRYIHLSSPDLACLLLHVSHSLSLWVLLASLRLFLPLQVTHLQDCLLPSSLSGSVTLQVLVTPAPPRPFCQPTSTHSP